VLSVIAVEPTKLGGIEIFAAELSRQLGEREWRSVLCFLSEPSETVARVLAAPSVDLEVLARSDETTIGTSRRFWQLVRRYRPSIVHLHFIGLVTPYPWLARLGAANRVFLTDHSGNYPRDPLRAPASKRLATRLIDHPITAVVAVSNDVHRKIMRADVVPATRTRRIYHGVDVSGIEPCADTRTQFRSRHGIPHDSVLVAQVGSLIPRKAVPDLLRTAAIVAERQPLVHFAIVGDGPNRHEYVRLADELGIQGRVTWTGPLEDPTGEGLYSACDVICLLSRAEGFGLVIAEAMAHARPVVAAAVGALPEVVNDGVTGYLVALGDNARAADAIERLVTRPDLRLTLGRSGRLRSEALFDVKTNVAELVRVYGIT
jgi:glycosyltransferase involved in cell wall biosynthesis